MIITKTVKIKRAGNNKLKHYEKFGYDVSTNEFEVNVEHLTKSNKSMIETECDICHNVISKRFDLYNKNISNYGFFTCSNVCGREKAKLTNLKKYGVENPTQNKEVYDKIIKTNIEKYGYKSPMQNEEILNKANETMIERYGGIGSQSEKIKEKIQKTMIEKYGVNHNMKLDSCIQKREETWLEKYGVDNPSKVDEIQEKKIKTSLKNWGVDHPLKNNEVMKKIRKTNNERYGVDYPMQSEEVRKKSIETMNKKYGVDHNSQHQERNDKMIQNNLKKYGTEHPFQSDLFRRNSMVIAQDPNYIKYLRDNISLFYCDCSKDHNFEINSNLYHTRNRDRVPLCTICYPISENSSIKEKELLSYIESIYSGNIIPNYRDGYEIDIYLPDLNLGFEFNGIYWHSEKFLDINYHFNKSNYFSDRDIKIIHIWEDDWDNKNDIIKSKIRSLLDKSNSIDNNIRIIEDQNNISLYYDNKLVSYALFDNNRLIDYIELFSVRNGLSKILKYLIINNSFDDIIIDRNWNYELSEEFILEEIINENKINSSGLLRYKFNKLLS